MRNRLTKYFIMIISFIIFPTSLYAQGQNCSSCHEEPPNLQKLNSAEERGVGIMNKGQVANYLGNYGVLSNFHEYFNEAIRWPANAGETIHYCFGLGLIVAVNGNVITSVVGATADKYDWVPPKTPDPCISPASNNSSRPSCHRGRGSG